MFGAHRGVARFFYDFITLGIARMMEFMRKSTPHSIRIYELARKLKQQPGTIRYWESVGLDIHLPLTDVIQWRAARSRANLSVENRGNLDEGLARMIVERAGCAHTQQEIADFCGVSRGRISEVEISAFRHLRRICRYKGLKWEDCVSALGSEFR